MHLDRRKFLGVVGAAGLSGCLHEPSVEELGEEELQEIAEELLEQAREDEVFMKAGMVETKVEVFANDEVVESYNVWLNRTAGWEYDLQGLLTMDVGSVSARESGDSNELFVVSFEPDESVLAEYVNSQFDRELFTEELELLAYPDESDIEISPDEIVDASAAIRIVARDREYLRVMQAFGLESGGGMEIKMETQNYQIDSVFTPMPVLD